MNDDDFFAQKRTAGPSNAADGEGNEDTKGQSMKNSRLSIKESRLSIKISQLQITEYLAKNPAAGGNKPSSSNKGEKNEDEIKPAAEIKAVKNADDIKRIDIS